MSRVDCDGLCLSTNVDLEGFGVSLGRDFHRGVAGRCGGRHDGQTQTSLAEDRLEQRSVQFHVERWERGLVSPLGLATAEVGSCGPIGVHGWQ